MQDNRDAVIYGMTTFTHSTTVLPNRPKGLLKSTCADFIVKEITQEGVVCDDDAGGSNDNSIPEGGGDRIELSSTSHPIDFSPLEQYAANPETFQNLQAYCQTMTVGGKRDTGADAPKSFVFETLPSLSKPQRAEIHQFVREKLPTLASTSVEGVGIELRRSTREDVQRWWPRDRGAFLHFTLKKENLDTQSAIQHLATRLNIPSTLFSYAGSKDKKAITYQRVSAFKVDWARIARLNTMHNTHMHVSNPSYHPEKLWLGALSGNHFIITVKGITPPWSKPNDDIAHHIATVGFLNYFGPQRFGTTAVATYEVGKLVLAKELGGALSMVLRSKAAVSPEFARAAEGLQLDAAIGPTSPNTKENYLEALRRCPHFCRTERDVLKVLGAEPNNVTLAWSRIPRNVRLLYIHSLQSFVWNLTAGRRHAAYGANVCVGDLVQVGGGQQQQKGQGDGEGEEDACGGDDDEVVVATVAVTLVTEANKHMYSITDVVLPIPGPGVVYPSHEFGRLYYESLLSEYQAVELLDPSVSFSKEYNAKGGYRKVMVRPQRMTWGGGATGEDDTDYTTRKFEFSLPSGCYA
eukprot:PhF_6_TR23821/c0_g1_i2/m.33380/K06176/truD, PUS7; tRNA pseudouridine13 synthase